MSDQRRLKLLAQSEQDREWERAKQWFHESCRADLAGMTRLRELLLGKDSSGLIEAATTNAWMANAVHRLAGAALGEIGLRATDDECNVIALMERDA